MELIKYILPFLMIVESNNDPYAIGKNEDLGILQITPIVVEDVNRLYGTCYEHRDCFDHDISVDIATKYLSTYGARYEQLTKKTITLEVLARIHNGGPNGWMKESTISYWDKVKKQIIENEKNSTLPIPNVPHDEK